VPDLQPVDGDPFTASTSTVPVNGDPWGAGSWTGDPWSYGPGGQMTQGAQQSAMKVSDTIGTTWPFRMVQGAWSGMMAPGDVLSGKLDPNSPEGQRRAFEAASFAMSGGLAGALDREGANLVGGGLRDSLQGTAPLDESLASKSAGIYNPPARPSRPFEADYPPEKWPNGVPADGQGNLTQTIDGQPLTARYVIGRTTVGGADTPLLPDEYDAITIGSIGKIPEVVPENQMPRGWLGFYHRLARPGEPSIGVLNTLSPESTNMVIAHEMGHVMDDLSGTIPTRDLYRELLPLYNHLNNPNRFSTSQGVILNPPPVTPESFGYYANAVPREYMAEAIRAYMADPNYIKTVAPQTAARIRQYVNSEPRLNHVIQFNSGGAPTIPAGASLAPVDHDPFSRPTIDQSEVYSPTNPGGSI
jgi:hypothetical protein